MALGLSMDSFDVSANPYGAIHYIVSKNGTKILAYREDTGDFFIPSELQRNKS